MGSNMSARCASPEVVPSPEVAPPPDVVPSPDITAPKPPSPASPETKSSNGLTNPGDFEELCKKVKEQLLPTALDGAKVVIQKGLSSNFQTSHTIVLGSSSQPASWSYGATYVGTTKIAENEFRPVFLGEIGTNGNFNSLILHQYGSWRTRINAQVLKGRWVGYQFTGDYIGSDFTGSCTVANPDVLDGSCVVVGQYLQALTSRLSLGAELMYQQGGGMLGSMLSVGGRYVAPSWEVAARLGLAWNATYLHKLDDKLTAVADMEGSLMQGETNANFGFKYDMTGGVTIRGRVSSKGSVTGTVEKTLDPLPGSVTLSAQVNHWTDEGKVGFAINLG